MEILSWGFTNRQTLNYKWKKRAFQSMNLPLELCEVFTDETKAAESGRFLLGSKKRLAFSSVIPYLCQRFESGADLIFSGPIAQLVTPIAIGADSSRRKRNVQTHVNKLFNPVYGTSCLHSLQQKIRPVLCREY